jgi:hypothetical protein
LALQDVWATKVAMNTVMLAYNLMGLPPSHQLRLLEVFMENLDSIVSLGGNAVCFAM